MVHVGVGHHGVERFAVPGPGARIGQVVDRPPRGACEGRVLHGLAGQQETAAEVDEQAHQGAHQDVHAAARIEHAPAPFEIVDEGIDGAGLERISPYQERVEAERLANPFVADVARHRPVHRAVGAQAGELRRHPHHVPEAQERRGGQLLVAGGEHAPRVVQEAAVAGAVGRIAAPDLCCQRCAIGAIVEAVAVRPQQPVERVDRQQLDPVAQVCSGHGEQVLQQGRIGYHRRAHVERETPVPPDVRPAARLLARLEQRGCHARRLQPDGGREPAETAADHRDARAVSPGGGHGAAPGPVPAPAVCQRRSDSPRGGRPPSRRALSAPLRRMLKKRRMVGSGRRKKRSKMLRRAAGG